MIIYKFLNGFLKPNISNKIMNYFFDTPEKSYEYIKVSIIRLGIYYFLLYALLHTTQMWLGFEVIFNLLAVLSIIYLIIIVHKNFPNKISNKILE